MTGMLSQPRRSESQGSNTEQRPQQDEGTDDEQSVEVTEAGVTGKALQRGMRPGPWRRDRASRTVAQPRKSH